MEQPAIYKCYNSYKCWICAEYVQFEGMIYQQIVGIPMGTNCAPLIADLLSSRNSVGGDIVTRPIVGGWVSEWVRGRVSGSVTLYLVDTIATTVFDQSLSNFTCKLWMMRGGTLLILGHGIKGQSNFGTLCIRPCGHDTDYKFSQITFRLHMQVVDDERRNHIDFRPRSQRSMSTLELYV